MNRLATALSPICAELVVDLAGVVTPLGFECSVDVCIGLRGCSFTVVERALRSEADFLDGPMLQIFKWLMPPLIRVGFWELHGILNVYL